MKTKSDLAANREQFWERTDYLMQGGDDDSNGRKAWFARVVALYNPKSVLELGCNEGSNLRRIRNLNPAIRLAGLEINPDAVKVAQATLPGAHIVCGSIYDADTFFKEQEFDLVFSMGVLIHVPPDTVEEVRDQSLRLAKRVVLHCEEHSLNPKPMRFDNGVPHRWSHNYLALYAGYPVRVYDNIVGSADGAHHLAVVEVGAKTSAGFLARVRVWYLCRLLPFVDKWQKRMQLRWQVRGPIRFFLP
ncbi:hypothetical protein A3A39_02430 [Candidatus Kaiserbacteria bacterium RIFCSPLOWO2_01_FULL_54_13]|uniref:Methyltransferase domain-containing protein n=1 Tax=Candidatus Kaiserbacteria bacterium RIFCSPLOWO2_01_FULL_54_13 TaxID=1798512 RepID=A0A1F6F137_9BACT|nr:MAG: hypothetical protein A3A39_02430 [Candidatus Kaiserbacteria bacterium RIFCSPLOWO2_01_FULL_54_13]